MNVPCAAAQHRQPTWPFTLTLALLGIMAGAMADSWNLRGAVTQNALKIAEQQVLIVQNAERLNETNRLLGRIVDQNTALIEQNRIWLRQTIERENP
jgi:hypothetical protein